MVEINKSETSLSPPLRTAEDLDIYATATQNRLKFNAEDNNFGLGDIIIKSCMTKQRDGWMNIKLKLIN